MTNNTQASQQVPSGMTKSVFLANAHYFYARTDGTYAFPNSAEGDLLTQAKKEIEELRALLAQSAPATDNATLAESAFEALDKLREEAFSTADRAVHDIDQCWLTVHEALTALALQSASEHKGEAN